MAASVRITPIQTGALRASGHVEPPEIDPAGATVSFGYGGASAPYAVYVHENLSAYHKPPTMAKFLELPVLAAIPGLQRRITARVRFEI
jgi:hypothetical protein